MEKSIIFALVEYGFCQKFYKYIGFNLLILTISAVCSRILIVRASKDQGYPQGGWREEIPESKPIVAIFQ